MVVVHRQHLHDSPRAAQAGVRSDEDSNRTCTDEAVDEVLRERPVDLRRRVRRPLTPVAARVVDVDVEPVLVRDVAGPAVAHAEVAAVGTTEIADSYARRAWVRGGIRVGDANDEPDEADGSVPPPRAIG